MSQLTDFAGQWLLQAGASLPDTIVTKQVVTEPGWFARVTSISSGLVSIALLVLTAFLVPAAWNVRKTHKLVKETIDRIYGDIQPLVKHTGSVVDNMDYISTSVRVDIQQVSQTIKAANQRLSEALAVSERRVKEFNALLRVVQEEAEHTFVSAASTLRGVRAGAAAFSDDAAAELVLDNDFDDEEFNDGYNDANETIHRRDQEPRVRPRTDRVGDS